MMSKEHPQGWISVDISEGNERWARVKRAERDRLYGNVYREAITDERWVGDLGELAFDRWLKHNGVTGYRWIWEEAAGAPDFQLASGTCIGVKTVKRKVPPRDGYTAQITARHTEEPIDQFFFMTYEITKRQMWLLGGIEKRNFLDAATYYPAGAQVHANYTIREGHEIYNVDIGKLMPPHAWLRTLAEC
jgi:hypothetical protein